MYKCTNVQWRIYCTVSCSPGPLILGFYFNMKRRGKDKSKKFGLQPFRLTLPPPPPPHPLPKLSSLKPNQTPPPHL